MADLLTKDAILSNQSLKRERLHVPEWGGDVFIRELTAAERDDYEQSLMDASKRGRHVEIRPNFRNAKARMAVKCIVDDAGTRLFADTDADALGRKSAAALNLIVETIQRLSGMTESDIEELEKNSATAPAGDSPSA